MDNFVQMVDILKSNVDIGQIALKAEFESEGTRFSELLRLKEIANGANIPMVVKIGGCDAIRDLLDCKDLRISNIVAPMIDSKYAASKIECIKLRKPGFGYWKISKFNSHPFIQFLFTLNI